MRSAAAKVFPQLVRLASDPGGAELGGRASRVVFHHLPKTGGSTFRRMLESLFDPEEVCPGELDREVLDLQASDRSRFRLFAGHFSSGLLEDTLADAVGLIFLRHPVDRVVSEFQNISNWSRYPSAWKQRVESSPLNRELLDLIAGRSLEDYLRLDDPRVRDRVENRQTRHLLSTVSASGVADAERCALTADIWNTPELVMQGSARQRFDESLIAEAKQHLRDRYAFVGIQEDFDCSLQLFAMTFGMRPFGDVTAYTANRNPSRSGGGYRLPAAVREELEERNAMDLELWRHGRKLMHERLAAFQSYFLQEDRWWRRRGRRIAARRSRAASTAGMHRSIDQLAPRRGFHRIERDGLQRPFCWSGYEDPAVLEVEVALPDRRQVKVTVVALSAIDGQARDALRITFDDRPLKDMTMTELDGQIRYQGTVTTSSPAYPRRHHAIKLFGPRSLEPDRAEHRRLLGVAVHAVEVEVG